MHVSERYTSGDKPSVFTLRSICDFLQTLDHRTNMAVPGGPDTEKAMKMAQQEMDYRVDLYNRCLRGCQRVQLRDPADSYCLTLFTLCAGWLQRVMTNAWTKGTYDQIAVVL